jgi:hypothetical protein
MGVSTSSVFSNARRIVDSFATASDGDQIPRVAKSETIAVAPTNAIWASRSATARCPGFRLVSPNTTIDVAAMPLATVKPAATMKTI